MVIPIIAAPDTAHLTTIWQRMTNRWTRRRLQNRKNARPVWDTVIITAANEVQAHGYELEIARRRDIGALEPGTNILIVPDRAGKRIGSGGATLWALKHWVRKLAKEPGVPCDAKKLFHSRRVLMLHCGGEGRRIPSNAGAGKLFSTLPFEVMPGRAASVFDALYVFLSACGEQMDEGMVICSGDVLAVFDPEELHWRRSGCCGIGIPAPLDLAAQHGIYIPDGSGRRVLDYPQKITPAQMREMGAVVAPDRVLIDGAGILKFSADICAQFLDLAGISADGSHWSFGRGLVEAPQRADESIDIYTDVAWPLAPAMTEEKYLRDIPAGKAYIRRKLWEALRGTDFSLDIVPNSIFVHLGNLWQILRSFESSKGKAEPGASADASEVFSVVDIIASYISPQMKIASGAHIQNSYLDCRRGHIAKNALVSECDLSGEVNVGARALLRGVRSAEDFSIVADAAVFAIPVGENSGSAVYCVHGVEDNPKQALPEGATMLGRPIGEWASEHGIGLDDLWAGGIEEADRNLWNARIHPFGGDEAFRIALWLQDPSGGSDLTSQWRKMKRYSFAEVFEQVDYKAGVQQREALVLKSRLRNIHCEILGRRDARSYLEALGAPREFLDISDEIDRWVQEDSNPLIAARMHAFQGELFSSQGFAEAVNRASTKNVIIKRFYGTEDLRIAQANLAGDKALRKVAEAVEASIGQADAIDLSRIVSDRVEILSPARVDLGGGWTDTPPQCLEREGVILNVAVMLNGEYPIRVVGERIEQPVIRLENIRMRESEVLESSKDLPYYQKLSDPYALVKSALATVGLSSLDAKAIPLEQRLKQWGHGFCIVTESRVPEGSGLGTSSILGAAVIACLRRLFGASLEPNAIFRQVLRLEQLLTSGGGWQDQVGALAPGIKLVTVPVMGGIAQTDTDRHGQARTDTGNGSGSSSPSPTGKGAGVGGSARESAGAILAPPNIAPLSLSPDIAEELRLRMVLFYVGKRRVAYNMLREIVLRYLSDSPDVTHALDAIHSVAFEMRDALLAGDFDRFGSLMTRTRMLCRLLYPGTTSETIENIFAAAAPYSSGGKCMGAGGGGFMMIIAKSPRDADRIRERLKLFSYRGLGEFYDFEVDEKGLHERMV